MLQDPRSRVELVHQALWVGRRHATAMQRKAPARPRLSRSGRLGRAVVLEHVDDVPAGMVMGKVMVMVAMDNYGDDDDELEKTGFGRSAKQANFVIQICEKMFLCLGRGGSPREPRG